MDLPMNENTFTFEPSSLTKAGRAKLADQLLSRRSDKIPTVIRMIAKIDGKEEILSNEVVYGGRVSFLRNLVKDQVVIPADKLASLNTRLDSNASIVPTQAELADRKTCLFCIGKGGNSVGGTIKKSHPDEIVLDDLIPFRARETNDDLPVGGLRDGYGLRQKKTVSVGGVSKSLYLYNAKAVDKVEFVATRLNGDYIPGTTNNGLNDFVSNSDEPILNTVLAVIYTLDMTKEDGLEYYKATGTLGDGSGFNELGLITALPKQVVDDNGITYTDYVGAELVTRFTMNTRPTDEVSKGYAAEYAVGS